MGEGGTVYRWSLVRGLSLAVTEYIWEKDTLAGG